VAQTHLPQHWIEKVCALLSVDGWLTGEIPHEVKRFFTAWAKSEGGTAAWNPLNTTDHISDAWGQWYTADFNRITVANYKSPWQGIVATAATMLQSTTFATIVEDVRTAKTTKITAEQIVQRNENAIKQWGTDPKLMLAVLQATE